MRRIRGSGLIALALAGCQGGGPAPVNSVEDVCAYRMSGGVCHVSPTQLLTAPEKLAGREVVVVLYYPGFGARVLFAARSSAVPGSVSMRRTPYVTSARPDVGRFAVRVRSPAPPAAR